MSFINEIVKDIGNEYATIAADINETEAFVDTGSFIFNANQYPQTLQFR